MNKKNSVHFLLIAISFALSWSLFFIFPDVMSLWSLRANDQLFQLRYRLLAKGEISPYIIHVDLDDTSLKNLPYSPNDKRLHGQIISILSAAGVEGIVMDMLFQKCGNTNGCDELVAATRKSKNTFYPVILRPQISAIHSGTNQHSPSFLWNLKVTRPGTPQQAQVTFANFPELNDAAAGIGHITCYPDLDGIFRRCPLLIQHQDNFIPSLALAVVCNYLGVTPENIEVAFGREITLHNAQFPDGRKRDLAIPIDQQGNVIINFTGPWPESFSHYSVATIYEMGHDKNMSALLLDELEGDIAIVSDVSTGSRDNGPVPLDYYYPLSGLHANIINAILKEDHISTLSPEWKLVQFILLMGLLYWAAVKLGGTAFTLVSIGIAVLSLMFSAGLFIIGNNLSDIIQPTLGIFLSFVAVATYKYLLVAQEKAFIRSRFEHYFAPDLLKKILRNPEQINSVEKKPLTILFSDIAGFTAWSSTQEAGTIHKTLNEYFEVMAKIVFKYEGTIDKYIGDGLLAFFGDPIEHHDHAVRAVSAAVDMQKAAANLRAKWSETDGMPLAIRIGINTGEVVVGNLGPEKHLDYTVIGAHVNLAQRLETSAQAGGILISKAVNQEVKDTIVTKPVGRITLKGFAEEFEVFEVEV